MPVAVEDNGRREPDPNALDLEGKRLDARDSHLAMLNVLEDFHQDRQFASQTNWAILNILDDFDAEKKLLSDTTKAVLNILEDLEEAKAKTEALNAQLEQRVAERSSELAQSEERFRLLVEGVTDYAIIALDTSGNVITWNAGAERIKGYSSQEIMGQHFSRFYPPEDRALGKPTKELEAAVRDGYVKDEGWRIRKDGSTFFADVVLTALRDDEGKLRGFVKLTRDITERKAAEAKAREALRQEMLLKEIHHRVKNNLQVISSLLYLQSTYVQDQNTLEILTESQSRVKSIALIHEKLYRSQNLEKLAFCDYVQDLLAEMIRTYRVHQEGIDLQADVKGILLGIDTAIPCGLIINELVANALKHAFPGERRGVVSVTMQPAEDGQFILTVHDNGVGLPHEFDWRRSKSLGLKLVMDLTKQLDGKIEVESNQGTTFRISFGEVRYKERG
jgi:PAS domain S-box-containing protein